MVFVSASLLLWPLWVKKICKGNYIKTIISHMKLCLKQWKNKQKFQEMVFLTSTLGKKRNMWSETGRKQVDQEVQSLYEGEANRRRIALGILPEKHCVELNSILRWYPHLKIVVPAPCCYLLLQEPLTGESKEICVQRMALVKCQEGHHVKSIGYKEVKWGIEGTYGDTEVAPT